MLQKIKRRLRPTAVLLVLGFAISLISVLIGISTLDAVLTSLSAEDASETPIFSTMQNTGLSLALSIWLFSVANCLVVTNYRIITKRRDMAICKAFGWTSRDLIGSVAGEISVLLLISLVFAFAFCAAFSRMTSGIISISITPFFVCGTLALLLFTLLLSLMIPIARILKIHPAEVIS